MSDYLSITPEQKEKMLSVVGVNSTSELYKDVPEVLRKRKVVLADGKSQQEVYDIFAEFASRNKVYDSVFLGAGSYNHYIPSVVKSITSREEFVTSYTPYQAEMSQGILQAIFEYQTMICELTGMDVSNASHYSGATAAAEGCIMCADRVKKVVTFDNVNPDTLDTLRTYLTARNIELTVVPAEGGKAVLPENPIEGATVYFESPNYYGLLEDSEELIKTAKTANCKVVMGCNPLSLALFRSPAELGADVAVGDGQPFGMPMSFGGPYLGYMAAKKEYMRKLPGRIVGETTDAAGERAYVLTLQAREQHIRREKATSNICSNEALCALTAAVYLSAMGKEGVKNVAVTCASNAHYLAAELEKVGAKRFYGGEFFHEFVTITPHKAAAIVRALDKQNILGGLVLDEHRILWCCTEMNKKADMDKVVKVVEEVYANGL